MRLGASLDLTLENPLWGTVATLREYFVKDGSTNLTTHQTWPVQGGATAPPPEVVARLHLDFEANAKFVSFYIPDVPWVANPAALVLNELPNMLRWPETTVGSSMSIGGSTMEAKDLVFTGRVYLYSEQPVPIEFMERLVAEAQAVGHHLVFRSSDYVEARNKWERPRAFISHDSRDKITIAQPLALALLGSGCPVWYDEFSLKVGDSLRGSIEQGLKECERCVLVLTPHFLANGGWSKKEYDAVFTRELVEGSRVILPVWSGVSARDVYEYSPALADRMAAQWSKGVDTVARELLAALG